MRRVSESLRETRTPRETENPAVFVIAGAMAAGKSTVADLLARRFPRGVHVRGDQFRRAVVSGRAEMSPEPSEDAIAQLHLRYRLAGITADTYAAAGFTVVVQDVAFGSALPTFVEAVTWPHRYVVMLAPTADVLAKREANRTKTGYSAAFTPETMDRDLRTTTPRIGLWLDTSALTPAETVDAILERRGEALA